LDKCLYLPYAAQDAGEELVASFLEPRHSSLRLVPEATEATISTFVTGTREGFGTRVDLLSSVCKGNSNKLARQTFHILENCASPHLPTNSMCTDHWAAAAERIDRQLCNLRQGYQLLEYQLSACVWRLGGSPYTLY